MGAAANMMRQSELASLSLIITPGCSLDEIHKVSSEIEDFDYTMDKDGLIEIRPEFS